MKFLITGLGNVGNEYAHTRHNIGFDVVAALVHKYNATFRQDRLAYVAEVKIKGRNLICICPTTYMNLSGKAFKYWIDKEKINLDNTLTIVDELALPITKLRIRGSGSDGGHNGLKSIQEAVSSIEYPKLRFGIGNNFPKGMQSQYVLGRWAKDEETLVKLKIDKCVEAIELFALQGISAAMNSVNHLDFGTI